MTWQRWEEEDDGGRRKRGGEKKKWSIWGEEDLKAAKSVFSLSPWPHCQRIGGVQKNRSTIVDKIVNLTQLDHTSYEKYSVLQMHELLLGRKDHLPGEGAGRD